MVEGLTTNTNHAAAPRGQRRVASCDDAWRSLRSEQYFPAGGRAAPARRLLLRLLLRADEGARAQQLKIELELFESSSQVFRST
jgi:hypothetical protein